MRENKKSFENHSNMFLHAVTCVWSYIRRQRVDWSFVYRFARFCLFNECWWSNACFAMVMMLEFLFAWTKQLHPQLMLDYEYNTPQHMDIFFSPFLFLWLTIDFVCLKDLRCVRCMIFILPWDIWLDIFRLSFAMLMIYFFLSYFVVIDHIPAQIREFHCVLSSLVIFIEGDKSIL